MESNDQPDERLEDMSKDDESIEIVSEGGHSHFGVLKWSSRSSIAGSDVSSMDFQKLSIHSNMATIMHHDGQQFIQRRDADDGGLPYSAEFYLGDELWKLSGEDCFLMSPRRYIAKVSVEGAVDLEGAVDFEQAVRVLLKHLKVVKVLLDEQLEECNRAKSVLEGILEKLVGELGTSIELKRDVMLLRTLLVMHDNSLSMDFKQDLTNCSRLSCETKISVDNYVSTALKLIQRNENLGHLNDSSLSDKCIRDAVQKALSLHRARLSAVCPTSMHDKLNELTDIHILYVSTDDMNLFTDLTTLDNALFDSIVPKIFTKFLTKVEEINDERLVDLDPLSHRIFLCICKSLQEVAGQLEAHTKNGSVINYSVALGWEVINPQEASQTPYSKFLGQQLHMLAALANHFELGGPFRSSHFSYEFKLFRNMDEIPEPVRIWLCLLDDCMKDLMQVDIDKMEMLSCFFKSYVKFIASDHFQSETLECLRTITHEALRSMNCGQFQPDRTVLDSDLLEYNYMMSRCLDKFLCENFGNDCARIQATLRRIIGQARNKPATSDESNEFLLVFKQLLNDISDLPLEWYLQLPPSENRNLLVRAQFVVPVDNRWKDTEHECLKVLDPDGFVKMYKLLHNGDEIPEHYQLKVIQVLLDKLAAKQSCYEGRDHLGFMPSMINSIRDSLLYLNRQPDYSSFEDFLQKISDSFSDAIERIILANNSTAIDSSHGEAVDPLLDLFKGRISKSFLENGLKTYDLQFNNYLTETVHLPFEKRIERIVSAVMLKVKPQLSMTWTEEFKRSELPRVLAGLSAVWFLIVSKDESSSEKLAQPSSMQISCALSLFGDQNPIEDDWYRLLHVSTQQGRGLVLGLTAALLALYGHQVLITCYNSNLTRRKLSHLVSMFKCFSVHSKISFGSVEDMARERSREDYEKYASYVHECLGIESNTNSDHRPDYAFQCRTSVLLIEDIDVFLLNKTLGQAFKRYVRPTIPGLALIQEKFFNQSATLRLHEIEKLVRQSDDPELCKLKTFIDRPQSYIMYNGPDFEESKFTNKIIYYSHVKKFDKNLISYDKPNYLRLSRNGVMVVNSMNEYPLMQNISYFSLKESDFQQIVNGYKNYGYHTIRQLPFPYAHLLKSYPLVFGFASAPLDGYEELAIQDHYNIYHTIPAKPPLPTRPIGFDSNKNFLCVDSTNQWDWMIAIMVAVNAAIARSCSVLVFFKTDREMELFETKFESQLKRLNVTSMETASNGENYSEDEIAVDEVTVLEIECRGDLGEDREVHVIQTFFSDDAKEEDIIRRQAERIHGSGSYELIVFRSHLTVHPDVNVTYDFLVQIRPPRSLGDAVDCLAKAMKTYEKVKVICDKL